MLSDADPDHFVNHTNDLGVQFLQCDEDNVATERKVINGTNTNQGIIDKSVIHLAV